jgi:hypothetical protein
MSEQSPNSKDMPKFTKESRHHLKDRHKPSYQHNHTDLSTGRYSLDDGVPETFHINNSGMRDLESGSGNGFTMAKTAVKSGSL